MSRLLNGVKDPLSTEAYKLVIDKVEAKFAKYLIGGMLQVNVTPVLPKVVVNRTRLIDKFLDDVDNSAQYEDVFYTTLQMLATSHLITLNDIK